MARKFALVSNGPYAGKSTLAKHLEKEYGFIRADHSLTLVEGYAARIGEAVGNVYANKEVHRQGLQRHGYAVGFNDQRADYWIRRTLVRAGCHITQARCPGAKPSVCPDKNVVFDSFRGEVQAEALRNLGFQLVQVNITDTTRCSRALAAGKTCSDVLEAMYAAPELELGIDRPDIVLLGEQPVEVLGRTLMHRPEGMRGLSIFGSH